MANVLTGLAGLKAYREEQAQRAADRERPKADWFMWTSTGAKGGKKIDTVYARFLNDWAEDTEVFKKNGAPILAVEHTAPGDRGYLRRALCTLEDEGDCYACQRHAMRIPEDKNGWKQKTNFYMNALVDFGDVKKVVLLSRGAGSTFVEDLLTELEDEGNISDANYRIKVSGEGSSTKWSVKRQNGDPFSLDGVEAYDLNELALRRVEYSKQAAYYGAVYDVGSDAPAGEATDTGNTSTDVDW